MKKERFYQIFSIALVIALVVCFVKIENLESEILQLQNTHTNDESRLRTQISSIHNNVDEQLKKQASLFSDYKVKYGELDKENQKANINVSLVPKTISNDMVVMVTVGSETVQMQKNGNEFSADILVGLFEEYNTFPLITITSNGETKTEYLEEHSLSYIWTNYLPTMRGGRIRSHKASWSGNSLTVDGELEIGFNLAELNKVVRFIKYNLITELNGKEISNEDITKTVLAGIVDDANFGGDFTMNFNETYKMSEKDTLALYLVAEDSLGYLHKMCAFSWTHPEEDRPQPEWAGNYGGEFILDKDGKVLFSKEF